MSKLPRTSRLSRGGAKPKTSAKKAFARPKKSVFTLRRLSPLDSLLLGLISASTLCIGSALVADACFDPVADAEDAMVRLAKDYYTEYLYPATLGLANINNPAPILSKATTYGLPPVRLRQLLLYNDSAKSEYSHYFSNPYYKCDTAKTIIRFFPIDPYGPFDYELKVDYACENLLESKD